MIDGKTLKLRRVAADVMAKDLAAAMGVSDSRVSRIENSRTVTDETVARYTKALDTCITKFTSAPTSVAVAGSRGVPITVVVRQTLLDDLVDEVTALQQEAIELAESRAPDGPPAAPHGERGRADVDRRRRRADRPAQPTDPSPRAD
jgi:transcriptional regulator with XRE-family HTH domain